jgi:superfamily I DNA/RNA helicase
MQKEYDEIKGKIEVYDFYDYIRLTLEVNWRDFGNPDLAVENAFENSGDTLSPRFDAILIDEGQDTTEIQLKIYRQLLKGNSFTFFYDNKQILYSQEKITERLENVGFNIVKEQPLVKQQRAVLVALGIAFYEFSNDVLLTSSNIEKNIVKQITRMFWKLGKLGKKFYNGVQRFFQKSNSIKESLNEKFHLIKKNNIEEIVNDIMLEIQDISSNTTASYNEILVIFPKRKIDDVHIPTLVINKFLERNIPLTYVDNKNGATVDSDGSVIDEKDNRRKFTALTSNTVKLMTIHTSKGYDARYVFIVAFDCIDFSDNQVSLGYVALTRTKEELYCYFLNENEIIKNLRHSMDFINKKFK